MDKFSDPIPSNPGNGVVRGDDKAMPDRGTSSGMIGMGSPYGADTGPDARNVLGSAHLDSDPAYNNFPVGDTTRFTASSHGFMGRGSPIGSWTDSDPADDNKPDDTRGLGSNQD